MQLYVMVYTALEGFKATPGPRLALFVVEIQAEQRESFYFHDHEIAAAER